MLTLNDVLDRLKKIDEVSLLEVLDIDSNDIVDRFTDRVEERFDELQEELQ